VTSDLAGKAIRDNAARMKLERRAIREIAAALQEQLNNALRGDKTPSAVTDKLDKYGKPLRNALRRTLLDGVMLGVTELMERLAAPIKAIPEEIQFGGVDWEMVNEEVRDWVLGPDMGDIPIGTKPAGYLGELYNQINQTSGKTLRRHMSDWIESGEHLDVLKKDLEPMFGKVRAALIASTEVTRAYVEGNLKAWKASGLVERDPTERAPKHPRCRCTIDVEEREPGVWHWVWLTAQDELVCFPAWTLVSTEFGAMPIQRVKSGMRVWTRDGLHAVSATSKRKYSGGMVTVGADGARVTSTADHLYWTLEHGWLEGRQLNRGHTLESFGEKSLKVLTVLNFSLGDTDNVPAVIRKVRGLASVPGFVLMPIRAIDFKRNAERCQKKINAISAHLGFLNIFKVHSVKALADCLFEGGLALKRTIASKAAELTLGSSGADSESLGTIAAIDIDRRASTLLGAIVSVKVLFSAKYLAASFASDIFGIGCPAFRATDSVSGSDGLINLEVSATDGAYLCDKPSLLIGSVASPRAEAFTALNSGRWSMKCFAAMFTGERFSGAPGKMITFCRAILGFFPRAHKRLAAAGTDFVIRHICHLLSDMVILYHRLSGTANYVYDITVDGEPEFYANGILVHNCPQCGPLANQSVGMAKVLPQEQGPVAGGVTPVTPWAPTMSREEADIWAADSEIQQVLYHGTKPERAERIVADGFSRASIASNSGNAGMLGRGFYFSNDPAESANYGSKILNARIKVKNVLFESEFLALARKEGLLKLFAEDMLNGPTRAAEIIQAAGYDAVQFQAQFVVFSPENIVVVS